MPYEQTVSMTPPPSTPLKAPDPFQLDFKQVDWGIDAPPLGCDDCVAKLDFGGGLETEAVPLGDGQRVLVGLHCPHKQRGAVAVFGVGIAPGKWRIVQGTEAEMGTYLRKAAHAAVTAQLLRGQ